MKKTLLLTLLCVTLWADAHIFVYHRFGDDRYPSTDTSLKILAEQFKFFKDNNYKVIPLSTLSKALKNHKNIPNNWVVLTIDDNYKSFYDNALTLFKEYNYPFTLFVYIKATNKKYGNYMSWGEIKEASKYGEIGLHSYGHEHMVSLSSKKIKEDTNMALASFKKNLGYLPKYYAYPYGEYDQKVKKVISSYGFELILNQNVGAVSKKTPKDDLDRIALTGKVNLKQKLRIKYLNAIWHSPKSYPTNGKLNKIHVTMPKVISKAELYVTGGGWEWIKVKNGELKSNKVYQLTKDRTRVIVRYKNSYSSKIIVKE